MKWKYSLAAAILSISISLCGCSRVNNDSQNESETLSEPKISQESSENISSVFSSERSAASESDSAQENPTQSIILIAYFTWAENTYVEDPEAVDVDATTSASVLPPGNAAKMAGWIQEEVGGDLFSIVVTEPYSSDYDKCLDRAAEEKADNARPELLYHVENMEDYDIVFLSVSDIIRTS